MKKGKREIYEGAEVLVRSCRTAGVATGDGRHQPIQAGQGTLDLADGCAIRKASVHWTPSAPVKRGRGAPTGPPGGGPNSVGPQPSSVRLWTPHAAPSFAGVPPWTPRVDRLPAGSPAPPPSRSPVHATKGSAPGPLGCARFSPGPRLRRPAFPSSSDQRAAPFGIPKRTTIINHLNIENK